MCISKKEMSAFHPFRRRSVTAETTDWWMTSDSPVIHSAVWSPVILRMIFLFAVVSYCCEPVSLK
ncbi:hypothetical protein PSTT_03813 [Puccinia striiformis]|uniref:Uncharacterized protein n=1 Tax=Puccinia striiformis TaxID=27350 RepID=A0A2S4VV77_9BASI|nr:hypothetical protein PSTT_03813 [Puccinia striiformis]